MRTAILSLALSILSSQALLAETPETIFKCRGKSVEVLLQKIENEESLLVVKKDDAARYHKCRKEIKGKDISVKCQGDEHATDIDFNYSDKKKVAKLKSGFLGISKKLKCRPIIKNEN